MAAIYPLGNRRLGYDGAILAKLDDGSSTTVYEIPADTVSFGIMENNDYPSLIDTSALLVNLVPGVHTGTLDINWTLKNDRGMDAFLTAAFGPRSSGQLHPWIVCLVPYSGGSAIIMTGVWFSKVSMQGQFARRGGDTAIRGTLSANVADPSNYNAASALTAPTVAGTSGTGITTFTKASFTNGAASSPTVYDGIRNFALSFDNQLAEVPIITVTADRLDGGWCPGQFVGNLVLTQLGNSTEALPQAEGLYPININLPDSSGSSTLRAALSVSYDSIGTRIAARDFGQGALAYTLFGTQTGNATGDAAWPFALSYGA